MSPITFFPHLDTLVDIVHPTVFFTAKHLTWALHEVKLTCSTQGATPILYHCVFQVPANVSLLTYPKADKGWQQPGAPWLPRMTESVSAQTNRCGLDMAKSKLETKRGDRDVEEPSFWKNKEWEWFEQTQMSIAEPGPSTQWRELTSYLNHVTLMRHPK